VTGYGHYQNGLLISTSAGASYTFSGLSCGTSYTLAVDAADAAGNRSPRTSITSSTSSCSGGDTTKPTAPSSLSHQVQTGPKVALQWTASTDNVAVTGYRIYRGGTEIGTSTTASYTDSSVAAGNSYTYSVRAHDAAGNLSDASNSVTATIPSGGDTSAPSAPPNFRLYYVTKTDISVLWDASTDNVGVTGYGLYRNGVLLGSVGASTRAVRYVNLTCGTTYTVAVDAVDAAGNRSTPSTLTAKTANC
jgi:chitodextrinase